MRRDVSHILSPSLCHIQFRNPLHSISHLCSLRLCSPASHDKKCLPPKAACHLARSAFSSSLHPGGPKTIQTFCKEHSSPLPLLGTCPRSPQPTELSPLCVSSIHNICLSSGLSSYGSCLPSKTHRRSEQADRKCLQDCPVHDQ